MKKYKSNNKPATNPRDEDIRKYKDFGKLQHNYEQALNKLHKKPLYKQPKTFFILALILLTAWLVSNEIADKKPEKTKQEERTIKE